MQIPRHDDFSRTPVSGFNLRSWWYLLIIEMGVMISIPIFVLGGQLGLGLTIRDLVLATFSGAAILGVIGALTARLGAITRCSTALIARITFGRKGAACIALLLAIGLGLIKLTTIPTLDSVIAAGVIMLAVRLIMQRSAAPSRVRGPAPVVPRSYAGAIDENT